MSKLMEEHALPVLEKTLTGMDGYVSKPIRTSELFSAIAAAAKDRVEQPVEVTGVKTKSSTPEVGWVESARPTTVT